MEYLEKMHSCTTCGGQLLPTQGNQWKCQFCGTVFSDRRVQKEADDLQRVLGDALAAQQQETINSLRRKLYLALNAEFISSAAVLRACDDIKRILPDDFAANFYEIASDSNMPRLCHAIDTIDVDLYYSELDGIIQYLLNPLHTAYLTQLNLLLERAYSSRDNEKLARYTAAIEDQAVRIDRGIYETHITRKAFIAYSHKDMPKVMELVDHLENVHGISCFVAARNLRRGRGSVELYNTALQEAMDNCTVFVLVSTANSRSFDCDAYRVEIPYIQKKDMENIPAEFRNHPYGSIPTEYKKPRVEYHLEDSHTAADSIVKDFFNGYQWVRTKEDVAERIARILASMSMAQARRQTSPTTKFCSECGAENALNTKFCGECGAHEFVATRAEYEAKQAERAKISETKICIACEARQPKHVKFCSECGGTEFVDSQEEYIQYLKKQMSGNTPRPSSTSGAATPPPASTISGPCTILLISAGTSKLEVIKQVREATGFGLKDAKDFVENAPATLMASLPADEANTLAARLKAAGASAQVVPAPDTDALGKYYVAREELRMRQQAAEQAESAKKKQIADEAAARARARAQAVADAKAKEAREAAARQAEAEALQRELLNAKYNANHPVNPAPTTPTYIPPPAAAKRGNATADISPKNGLITLLLCLFLGVYGGHLFYVGNVKKGIFRALFFILGAVIVIGPIVSGLLTLVDLIRIVTGKFKDSNKRIIRLSK